MIISNGADSTTLLKDRTFCRECGNNIDGVCIKFKVAVDDNSYCDTTHHKENSSRLETTYCFECEHAMDGGEFIYCEKKDAYKHIYNYCYGNYRKEDKMYKGYCDNCGKELEKNNFFMLKICHNGTVQNVQFDLCPECEEKMKSNISKVCESHSKSKI